MADDDRNAIQGAAMRLRAIAQATEEGNLIGNEDALTKRLQASVSSIRQAARLVEREGLLLVKRGRNGGYFAARPSENTVEAAIANIDVGLVLPEEIYIVNKAVWSAAVAKVAQTADARLDPLLKALAKSVQKLKPDICFDEIRALEKEIRAVIFRLSGLRHLQLMANINTALAGRAFGKNADDDRVERHAAFVEGWKKFTLLQLEGIIAGDEDLAAFAAERVQALLLERML